MVTQSTYYTLKGIIWYSIYDCFKRVSILDLCTDFGCLVALLTIEFFCFLLSVYIVFHYNYTLKGNLGLFCAGSSFSILSRSFMEFCILGEDNLPRLLLMYFANTPASLSNYFPTVLCNSRQFNRTVINQNLLYAVQDSQRNDLRPLNSTDFDDMIRSGAIFAEKFQKDDPVLDLIDQNLLGRSPRSVVPGGWCLGEPGNSSCLTWGDAKILRPGTGAQRLEKAIVELLANGIFRSRQCIYE